MRFLSLIKDVVLVQGALRGAIYDFNTGKVYSINEDAVNLLKQLYCDNRIDLNSEEKEFVTKLKELHLINDNLQIEEIDYSLSYENNLKFSWLELTENCNESCIHCYGQFGHTTKRNMPYTEWKKILCQLKNNGCENIQFIGGEPLLHKDFIKILNYAIGLEFKNITVFTNATLLNEDIISIFKKFNVGVRVSLYGHNEKVHEGITQKKGSFGKTVNNLKLLKQEGVNASIAIIIMKENEKHIKNIKNFITELGYKYSGFDVIRPTYIGEEIRHSVSDEILRKKTICIPDFYANKDFFIKSLSQNTCWYGKIAITPQGDVLPCVFEREFVIGNILDCSLSHLLNSSKLNKVWHLTKDNVNGCQDCEYRYACRDCRPLGKTSKDQFYEKFSRCTYNPTVGKWF